MELPKYIIKAFKLKEVKECGTNITYEETEAIPIDWIEEWLKKMPKHTTPYFYKRFLKNAIRGMVKDWRQENEE